MHFQNSKRISSCLLYTSFHSIDIESGLPLSDGLDEETKEELLGSHALTEKFMTVLISMYVLFLHSTTYSDRPSRRNLSILRLKNYLKI